ncbi:MAG: hypothetical protein ACYDGS_00665 [Thermoleophilia bacterium]
MFYAIPCKRILRTSLLAVFISGAIFFVANCGGTAGTTSGQAGIPETDYNPAVDATSFNTKIDNKYFPLIAGKTLVYQGIAEGRTERNELRVTRGTRKILGVTCVVVEDKVFSEGQLTEATEDWYSQDKEGNVWYFGEDAKSYENGKVVSTEGSWEAGKDGAKPGIIMRSNPKNGDSWRQEYREGTAEDMAEVIGLNEIAAVPAGSFSNCVKTKDWTPLKPEVIENKLYCPEIGVVSSTTVQGGSDKSELKEIQTG